MAEHSCPGSNSYIYFPEDSKTNGVHFSGKMDQFVSLSLFIEVFYFGEIILQNKVIWKSSY
jgi:hypothetical protein